MTLEGLSSVCAKLELASSKNNEILEINVLQKFTSHAFYLTCETLRYRQGFLAISPVAESILAKISETFLCKTHKHTKNVSRRKIDL